MALSALEEEIVSEFELFDDPMDKYEHIIEMGNELPAMEEKYKTDSYLVKGCQSKVWLRAYKDQGKIYFQADSNTVITKGIIGLLIKVLSGKEAKEIEDHKLEFIDRIDLKGHLSSQRANGLSAMIGKMRMYAAALA